MISGDYASSQRGSFAEQPHERRQAGIAHWQLANGTGVDILNIIDDHYPVRRDVIDASGTVTLPHDSRPHHVGLGRQRAGSHVLVPVDDLDSA